MLHGNKKSRGMEAKAVKAIDDLSNDVLLEIFSWLDAQSLRKATLVCKDWNELIGSSASTMKMFKIVLDSCQSFDRNMIYRRKHHNAFIKISDENEAFLDHFDVSRVKNLTGRSYRSDDSKLILILRKMPMLEKLEYKLQKDIVPDASKMQQVVLHKLKKLDIHSMKFRSLQFITAQQLKGLMVSDYYGMQGGDDIDELIKFLGRSENLEILKVDSITIYNIFNSEIAFEFKFKLLSFEWKDPELPNTKWENFNSFLISQGPSLRTLDLKEVENVPQLIFSTIFSKLQRLNTLSILASSLPEDQQFYDKVRPVFTLTELALCDGFVSDEASKGLFGNCPNLAILYIKGIIGEEINFLAEYNRKLETLKVKSINSLVSDNFELHNLKSLSLTIINSVDNWISLIIKCPQIETVEVLWVYKDKITDDTIDFLVQQASLRVLRLSGDPNVIKLIFDKIKTNYGNLKTMELSTSVMHKNYIKFDFPENTSDWIIEEEQKRFDDFFI